VAESLKLAFVGCGNVAWHLAPALENAGYRVHKIYSRHAAHARALQQRLYQANVITALDFSDGQTDLIFLTVADRAIEPVASRLIVSEKTAVVHTSGSQPIERLQGVQSKYIGVFYPLQTFSQTKKVTFEDIPILVESPSKPVRRILTEVASALSKKMLVVNAERRMMIHLAAVFACNFTNHMFKIATEILAGSNLGLDFLRPLIAETLNKSLEIGPGQAQTGPARRGDLEVLDRHMAYLGEGDYADLYRIISQQILDQYGEDAPADES